MILYFLEVSLINSKKETKTCNYIGYSYDYDICKNFCFWKFSDHKPWRDFKIIIDLIINLRLAGTNSELSNFDFILSEF